MEWIAPNSAGCGLVPRSPHRWDSSYGEFPDALPRQRRWLAAASGRGRRFPGKGRTVPRSDISSSRPGRGSSRVEGIGAVAARRGRCSLHSRSACEANWGRNCRRCCYTSYASQTSSTSTSLKHPKQDCAMQSTGSPRTRSVRSRRARQTRRSINWLLEIDAVGPPDQAS